MENNIYYWQVEVILYLRMKEIRREMEKGAPHKDDELQRPGILGKLVLSIGKGLVGLGRRMQSMYTDLDSQY